jgi:simple sugar transport system ATP-binding protein
MASGKTEAAGLTHDTEGIVVKASAREIHVSKEKPVVVLDRISVRGKEHEHGLENLSLEIQMNEVFGIASIVGNGERTLAKALSGLIPMAAGRFFLHDLEMTHSTIIERLTRGVRWLPANPLEELLLPSRPLWENCILGNHRSKTFHHGGWMKKKTIEQWAMQQINDHKVKYRRVQDSLWSLSGGNQQKAALAKVLSGSMRFVILEQPGRGLDIRAQVRLQNLVRGLSAQGISFLIISHDLDELQRMCHRIGVLYRGRFMGVESKGDMYEKKAKKWMLGVSDV